MDSFSGYFWKSMNNILNYWNIQRKNCKELSIHPDDLAEDFIQLGKLKEGTVYSMEKRYIASPENYLD
jgi:hypothetical protein